MEHDKLLGLKEQLKVVAGLRQEKDRLEAELKSTNAELEEQSYKCALSMEEQGVKSVDLEGVGKCYYTQSTYPKVIDQEALFADLRVMDAGSLIKEGVHALTLRSFVTERLEQNLPIPKGLDLFTKKTIKIKGGG